MTGLMFTKCCSVTDTALARPSEHLGELSDVKNLVSRLYTSMHIEQHQLEKESQLLGRLHTIQAELQPMETVSIHLILFLGGL